MLASQVIVTMIISNPVPRQDLCPDRQEPLQNLQTHSRRKLQNNALKSENQKSPMLDAPEFYMSKMSALPTRNANPIAMLRRATIRLIAETNQDVKILRESSFR
jgi:hypothetical protein